MNPTPLQIARREKSPNYCPCGQPAIKRDGASYVCADCLRKDQVAHAITKAAELQFERTKLTAEQYEASLEKKRANEWFSRRAKRTI